MNNQPNYYNIKRQYALKFFQVPKVFMTSDKYKKLSAEAKLAFAILSDRLQLSIKNKWFDKDGNIYFIYTGEQLGVILGCSHNKVNSVKNELKEAGLLLMKRMGQGKANRMYLLEPEITDNDIYGIDQLETTPNSSMEKAVNIDATTSMSDEGAETLDNTRFLKKGNLDFLKRETSDTDISNTKLLKNINTDSLETDTISDHEKSITEQQDAALFENHLNNDSIFTKQHLLDLKLLSGNDFGIFLTLQQTVLRAKKQALNAHKLQSSLFDLHDADIATPIHDTLMRAVQKVRLNQVNDLNSYLYSVIYTEFEKIGNARCIASAKAGYKPLFWD
ncbi:replication initiator protein A [Latilactobacillus fragifolii]|uniref:replication initiator protein A n=1 Tax=Latilactobacillus fragifolii TaxID=2814244 RepID=UPI001ABB41BC|nr:replication initiator protein A [Latilactobacillus fragifolii]